MKRRSLALTAALTLLSGVVATTTSGATHATYRAAIYSIRDDGTERRLIAEPDPPVTTLVRSPGGRSILFTREIDGKLVLFAAEASGANAVRLSPPGTSATISAAPSFSPDGRTIAFSTFVLCGWRCQDYTLYVVNRDGSALRRVAEDAAWPSWAPDSQRFAYEGLDGIYVHDIESETSRLIAAGRAIKPAWAPRGERIAYNALQSHARACFVNADGSRRRCTRPRHELTSLVWSRDGKRVAFRAATQRLGVVDSDAKRIRFLAGHHGQHARPAAWSPDGKRLAYWFGAYGSYDGYVHVLRLDAPTRWRRLVREDGGLTDLRWRGRRISYVVIRRESP
jgi:dipeptidyl aminopeptidase/acylaminoacyl peptidase